SIAANSELRFSVQFAPKQIGAALGALDMTVAGQTAHFPLTGAAIGPMFTYAVQGGSGTVTLTPGQTITVPDTAVGDKKSVAIIVGNSGNAAGKISVINVSGSAFTLADAPFVPVTINPGASQTLSVTFAPAQPGPASGRLLIGDDAFALTSNGIGPALLF